MKNTQRSAKVREAIQGASQEEGQVVPAVAETSIQEAREQRPTGLRGRSEKAGDGADLRDAHRLVLESCPDRTPHARMSYMMEHGLSRGEAVIAGVRDAMSMSDRRMYLGWVFRDASPEEVKAALSVVTGAGVPLKDILLSTDPQDMHRVEGLVCDRDLYHAGREIQEQSLSDAYQGEILEVKPYYGCSFEDAVKAAWLWHQKVRKAAGFVDGVKRHPKALTT